VQDIMNFYSEHSDDDRLSRGWGMLEFARSKEIVLRHLPRGTRIVLDGGAAAPASMRIGWPGSAGGRMGERMLDRQ